MSLQFAPRALAGVCLLIAAAAVRAGDGGVQPPVIAVASNMTVTAERLAEAYERASGERLRLSFGSSGNFFRQILQGAPFELFMSADEAFVLQLAERGYTVDTGVRYAIGRIGLYVPDGSPLPATTPVEAQLRAAAGGGLRIAIAHPEHAPYGRAAREVFAHLGILDALEAHLVIGENIAQAMQFATSGSVDAGVIPLSHANLPEIRARGRFTVIPAEWHAPLNQRMVLLRGASAAARGFYEFVQAPAGRAIVAEFGYAAPAE
jgi:molybdate transport system substrate-binding protein